MASVLNIAGSDIDRADNSVRCVLNALTVSVDSPDVLEFGQVGVTMPGTWQPGQAVTLTIDGTLRFTGEIVTREPIRSDAAGWTVGYRALGLAWLANRIPITNAQDGTGVIRYNLPVTDDDYIAANAGLDVGTILHNVFTDHSTALTAVGITGFTSGDLTGLTIVPNEPVTFSGQRFWNSVVDFATQWYPQLAPYIEPGGTIRVRDTTAFSATTVTLDDDTNPWSLDSISEDTSECATRVVLRGGDEVEGAQVSLAEATLSEAFSSGDKSSWNWYQFTQPLNSVDDGSINSLTSTTVTLHSSDTSRTWATNYWNGIDAWIQLVDPTSSTISFSETRKITACGSLSAGGTCTITLDRAISGSSYTKYHIVGDPQGINDTWRLYDIVPTYVADHLVKKFNSPQPWRSYSSVVQTSYPAATVCWSATGSKPYLEFPATFEILPASGQIRFTVPVVRIFGTLANLEAGGASTDGIPTDIKVFLAYSRGTLTATYPPDSGGPVYDGLAHDLYTLERTVYRDYPQWLNAGDQSSYDALAEQVWRTTSAPVIEGTLNYEGKYSAALAIGMSVNIAGNGYTTGYESIAAAVRTVRLTWPQGSAAAPWKTELQFSTRRQPYSGDKLYEHPMFASEGVGASWEGIDYAGALEKVESAIESGPLGGVMDAAQAEGITQDMLSSQGAPTDLGVPQIAPGYGGEGDLGIPSFEDLFQ
jgi:hypothetical protein